MSTDQALVEAWHSADTAATERDALIFDALRSMSLREVAEVVGVSHATIARARDRHLQRDQAPRAAEGGSEPPLGASQGD